MRGLKKTLRQYATPIELLVRMVICFTLLISCPLLKSDESNYSVQLVISAVQNKHMFVYNPDSGRSVVINASLVDVSPYFNCITQRHVALNFVRCHSLVHILQI